MDTQRKTTRNHLHRTITKLVRNTYPGCDPEFVGDVADASPCSRKFGFRIVDAKGKYRTDVIMLAPAFYHRCNKTWLEREVSRRGGWLSK